MRRLPGLNGPARAYGLAFISRLIASWVPAAERELERRQDFSFEHRLARAVAPGAIETDFGGGAVHDNAQINGFIASQTALGRVGLPDDIGGVIASLLSSDNGWINAQRIEASGGMFL